MDIHITRITRIGQYNRQHGGQNQDVICKREKDGYAVVALADGMSSCKCAAEGAGIACRTAVDFFLKKPEELLSSPAEKTAFLLVELIRHCLLNAAQTAGNELTDYSSTLLLCGINKSDGRMLLLNLGDGAAICRGKNGSVHALMPKGQDGMCCSTTTDKAFRETQVHFGNAALQEEIIIMSDGVINTLCGGEDMSLAQKQNRLMSVSEEYVRNLLDSTQPSDDCSFIAMYPRQ